MTRSSRTRRAKFRAKKRSAVHSTLAASGTGLESNSGQLDLSLADKRYLICFGALSLIITAIYWSMGGRNLFVFPALLCISVGARKYWQGPIRRFAESSQKA